MIRGEAGVFVQVESRHLGEIEPIARVHRGQFRVKRKRRAPRGQPEDGARFCADERGGNPGGFSRGFPGGGCDDNFHTAKL